MSDGSLESSRPKRMHAEDLTQDPGGGWAYTLCGHMLPRGFVRHAHTEGDEVTCRNCLRTRGMDQ